MGGQAIGTNKEEFLDCPECNAPAIPASEYKWSNNEIYGTWTEDDTATCPGCGLGLRAFITEYEGTETMIAIIVSDPNQ